MSEAMWRTVHGECLGQRRRKFGAAAEKKNNNDVEYACPLLRQGSE